MVDTAVVVINASEVLTDLTRSYAWKLDVWQSNCASVRAGFKKKTSRTVKNGKEYESTNWYKIKSGGGLESVGKEEPDYEKYYPPKPEPAFTFKFQEYEGHVILEEKDYEANKKLFKDCLAFRLEECRNFIHPLYKNPQKAIDSVRKGGVSSGRSQISGGTENEFSVVARGEFALPNRGKSLRHILADDDEEDGRPDDEDIDDGGIL